MDRPEEVDGKRAARSRTARGLSVALAALLVLVVLAVGQSRKARDPFGLGDYSGADIAQLEQGFEESGTDSRLIELLKALCYKAEVEGDRSEPVTDMIAYYGGILLDRAKAGETDLQSLDTEDVMLELLGYIRSYGAQ